MRAHRTRGALGKAHDFTRIYRKRTRHTGQSQYSVSYWGIESGPWTSPELSSRMTAVEREGRDPLIGTQGGAYTAIGDGSDLRSRV